MARRFGRLWLTAAGMALGLVLCYALVTVGAVSANHTATRLDSISRRRDD